MSTPRVPPVPPNKGGEIDRAASKPHRTVEKVEKVSEIDDETRARKFRQFVEAPDEEESSLQTPFTLFSSTESSSAPVESIYSPTDPSLDDAAEVALPSPSYSPPPSAMLSDTVAQDSEESSPLPQSQQFWQDIDEPPEPTSMQSEIEESPTSTRLNSTSKDQTESSSSQESTQVESEIPILARRKSKFPFSKTEGPLKEIKESPFGPPGKPMTRTSIVNDKREALDAHEEKENSPLIPKSMGPKGVIVSRGEEGPKYISPFSTKETKREDLSSPMSPAVSRPLMEGEEEWESLLKKGEDLSTRALAGKKIVGIPIKGQEREKGEKGAQKEEMEAWQIPSPTTTPLPPSVVPIAGAAASAASPYLGIEALAVYFHIIGTITAMISPKGDSLTEFVLNAPGFANSKFYGATISIEKFATAPDQLNIRLTGSNDAVAAFNQNIPNFLAGFANGRFPFTIHRIEAVYEKPFFKRKEKPSDKGGQ